MSDTIILRKVTMRRPNSCGIYAPSRLFWWPVRKSAEEFAQYSPVSMLVSFADDHISDPVEMVAYGRGLDCWYIVEQAVPKRAAEIVPVLAEGN